MNKSQAIPLAEIDFMLLHKLSGMFVCLIFGVVSIGIRGSGGVIGSTPSPRFTEILEIRSSHEA
jgi:hypothetical protein